jgi:hypothetical protein
LPRHVRLTEKQALIALTALRYYADQTEIWESGADPHRQSPASRRADQLAAAIEKKLSRVRCWRCAFSSPAGAPRCGACGAALSRAP